MDCPRDHFRGLTGLDDVEVVDEDGSARGKKFVVLWNPPKQPDAPPVEEKVASMRKRGSGKAYVPGAVKTRASPLHEAAYLLARAVMFGLRTVVFVKVRCDREGNIPPPNSSSPSVSSYTVQKFRHRYRKSDLQ